MPEAPFAQWLDEALDERDISQRELARITRRQSDWGSSTTLSHIITGILPPSLEALEVIARALEVKPEIIPEYRMAVLRRDLNPERVGFQRALRTLQRLER